MRHEDKQALDIHIKDMQTNENAEKQTCRQMKMQKNGHVDIDKNMQKNRQKTCRKIGMQTNRHADTQTLDNQTGDMQPNTQKTYRQIGIRQTDKRHAQKQTCRQV